MWVLWDHSSVFIIFISCSPLRQTADVFSKLETLRVETTASRYLWFHTVLFNTTFILGPHIFTQSDTGGRVKELVSNITLGGSCSSHFLTTLQLLMDHWTSVITNTGVLTSSLWSAIKGWGGPESVSYLSPWETAAAPEDSLMSCETCSLCFHHQSRPQNKDRNRLQWQQWCLISRRSMKLQIFVQTHRGRNFGMFQFKEHHFLTTFISSHWVWPFLWRQGSGQVTQHKGLERRETLKKIRVKDWKLCI